jgi:hypothetical protein
MKTNLYRSLFSSGPHMVRVLVYASRESTRLDFASRRTASQWTVSKRAAKSELSDCLSSDPHVPFPCRPFCSGEILYFGTMVEQLPRDAECARVQLRRWTRTILPRSWYRYL